MSLGQKRLQGPRVSLLLQSMAESLTLVLGSDIATLTQSWRQKSLSAKIPSQIALVDKKYIYKNYKNVFAGCSSKKYRKLSIWSLLCRQLGFFPATEWVGSLAVGKCVLKNTEVPNYCLWAFICVWARLLHPSCHQTTATYLSVGAKPEKSSQFTSTHTCWAEQVEKTAESGSSNNHTLPVPGQKEHITLHSPCETIWSLSCHGGCSVVP